MEARNRKINLMLVYEQEGKKNLAGIEVRNREVDVVFLYEKDGKHHWFLLGWRPGTGKLMLCSLMNRRENNNFFCLYGG